MKKLSKTLTGAVLSAFIFIYAVSAQTASVPAEISLPEGTAIKVHLTKDISSKTAQRGDQIDFVVDEDVIVDGQTLVKKDSIANATVIYAEKSGYLGHSGKLAVQTDSTKTVDDKALTLSAAKGGEGDSASGATIALSMLAGPFGLLKKGGDTVIKEGTQLTVYTAESRKYAFDGSVLTAVAAAAAAAASGDPATVYIYRPKKLVGSALEPSVFCDGLELARMDNGRYFVIKLPAGKHTVHMTDAKKGYELNMGPGETYYFRIGVEAGMWKGEGKLILESNDKGTAEVKKIKPLGADKIRDKTMVQAVAETAN